jgi:hypothetical protein
VKAVGMSKGRELNCSRESVIKWQMGEWKNDRTPMEKN